MIKCSSVGCSNRVAERGERCDECRRNDLRTDGGEPIRSRDVSLGEPGSVTIEYSDSEGDGFTEEFELEPGSAMVIEGPDGFIQTYGVPEEVGDG